MSNLNESRYLIVYHKEDNDGLFSMAIVYNYFVHEIKCDKDKISLLGADYNDLNSISDEDIKSWKESFDYIVMTDICFNNNKRMIELKNMFEDRFVWIDHHAPVINESYRLKFDDINGERNTLRSALLNAYKYYYDQFDISYNDKKVPEILRILSAYDSWSYEREGYTIDYVMAVNKAITHTFKLNPQKVIDFVYKVIYTDTIDEKDILSFYVLGNSFIEYDKANYKSLIDYYGDFSFVIDKGDIKEPICVLFYQAPTGTYVFESCKDRVNHGAVFKRLPTGNWVLSLYNTKNDIDFHCGEFCKTKYNGGGHKGAAGAQLTEAQFKKILKTKTL